MIIRLFMRRVTLATILTIVEFMFIYRFLLDRFLLKIENHRQKKKKKKLNKPIFIDFEIEVVICKRELRVVFFEGVVLPIFISILYYYFICYVILILSKMILSLVETMAWVITEHSVLNTLNIILLNIVKGGHNWKKENIQGNKVQF